MVKVVWTDQAIQDLNDIGEYIAKDSERYAREVIRSLFESTEIIVSHPKAGRIVPEYNIDYLRELIRGSYRIVYRVVDKFRIDILIVHYSARQLKIPRISRRIK
jgi:addiction module RelE/StbE family toxin